MTETIDLVGFFIAKKIPEAFYDMGHYLELGYGVKQDVASSRAYFRRAADMGNPDAHYYVGRLLSEVQNAECVTLDMYRCAMEQGSRMAARDYSNYSKFIGMYAQSLLGYQQAVRNGDDISANRLTNAFQGPLKSDRIYYLALEKDSERVERYRKISEFLSRHEHLGAKIPDLDDIVPLPPAALPEWDGTFKWQRDRDAYVPVIPSQELIEKLSAEKGLDPATGLPLSPRNLALAHPAGRECAKHFPQHLGQFHAVNRDVTEPQASRPFPPSAHQDPALPEIYPSTSRQTQ